MRKYILLLLLPVALGITVSYSTIPPVLYPGTNGKILLSLSTQNSVQDIEVKFGDSVFSVYGEDEWKDVGDLYGGTTVYDAGISVPSSTAPGTYVLPLYIRYSSGGEVYNEYYALTLKVHPEKEIYISVESPVDENKINEVEIKIHSDERVYGVKIYHPDSMEGFKYIGEVYGDKEVEMNVIPLCTGGKYIHKITLTGYDSEGYFSIEKNITVICRPYDGIVVDFPLGRSVEPGEHNTILTIKNTADVSVEGLTVEIDGSGVVIGGKKKYFFKGLAPGEEVKIPVSWRAMDEEDAVEFSIKINGKEYTFSSTVRKSARMVVYVADSPVFDGGKIKFSLGVANAGNGDASNVIVLLDRDDAVEGKISFIGDLSPGDYDTITVLLERPEEKVTGTVKYTENGVEKEEKFEVEIRIPQGGGFPLEWIIIAALLGYIAWRRMKK